MKVRSRCRQLRDFYGTPRLVQVKRGGTELAWSSVGPVRRNENWIKSNVTAHDTTWQLVGPQSQQPTTSSCPSHRPEPPTTHVNAPAVQDPTICAELGPDCRQAFFLNGAAKVLRSSGMKDSAPEFRQSANWALISQLALILPTYVKSARGRVESSTQ
jgi:hypothetical protein